MALTTIWVDQGTIYSLVLEKHYVHLEWKTHVDFAGCNDWWNSSLIAGTERLFGILSVSVTSICRSLTYVETVPSFLKRFSKDDLKSLYAICKCLSCKRLILLLTERLWNIQIRGQWINCELKNEFIIMRHFLMFMNGVILDNALVYDWLS